jgi:hypothetical protein
MLICDAAVIPSGKACGQGGGPRHAQKVNPINGMACGYDEQHSVTNTNYCMAVEEHCIARYVILYDILLSCCYLIYLIL